MLLALCAGLLVAARSARAEIIDFDPQTGTVPAILDDADRAQLATLTDIGFPYALSTANPSGTRLYGAFGDALGFLDLATGAVTPLGDELPGQPLSGMPSWQDDTTLTELRAEVQLDDQGNPIGVDYSRVRMNALTGAVTAEPVDLSAIAGDILSVSPDLSTLLVMEMAEGAPPPKTVTIAPTFERPDRQVPEGAPGVIGDRAWATITLQQASFKLVLVGLDGANRRELATLPASTGLAGVSWSPDGSRLAIGTRTMPDWDGDRQRNNQPPYAGLPNLGSINVREALGLVPPTENPLVTGTRFGLYAVATGSPVGQLANTNFQQGLLLQLAFSPSGQRIVLVIGQRSAPDERQHPIYSQPSGIELWLLDASLQPVKQIRVPGMESLVSFGDFIDDGRMVLATPEELNTRLSAYDLATDAVSPLWHYPGSSFQALGAGDKVVFTYSNVDRPWEMWRVNLADGASRPLTAVNAAAAAASGLRADEVSWTTSGDETIYGLYVHHESMPFPPAAPGPMIVWQQGGPGGQMLNDYGSSVEAPYSILPNFGMPVLLANAAGRSIKSPAFYTAMADGTNFGQLDIRQIKEGVDHLVQAGIADPRRVGITGCSYGGYFTLQSLRAYPDLYAAANAQCSLVDLTEEFNFGYTPYIGYLMGRAPLADPMEYLRDSPLYGSRDVKTPTLLFHGTNDFLPLPLINNLHDQIATNGVDVRFLRVAGEGHGFGHPKSQQYAGQEQIAFFRAHLNVGSFRPGARTTIFLPSAVKVVTEGVAVDAGF
jgi:dienelactone hydrolase